MLDFGLADVDVKAKALCDCQRSNLSGIAYPEVNEPQSSAKSHSRSTGSLICDLARIRRKLNTPPSDRICRWMPAFSAFRWPSEFNTANIKLKRI